MPLTPIQKRNVVQISIGSLAILMGLCVVSLLGVGGIPWTAQAAEDACCKAGDETPPLELVKQVPKGDLFVLGDNRCDSMDSREFGPITESSVVGRAFAIIWPLGRIGLL